MGSGISDAYGMPTVAIYNEFGSVVASASAAQTLADDGFVRLKDASAGEIRCIEVFSRRADLETQGGRQLIVFGKDTGK